MASGRWMTAILFDIDGTLLDHDAAERAGTIALHRKTKSRLPVDEFRSRWSAALEHHFERYLQGYITYEEQGRSRVREVIDGSLSDVAADRTYAEYLREYEQAWSLFPDVLPCLDRLSRRRLGIISNGLASEQTRKLVSMGIDARFQAIVISGDWGYAKPSAEIFELGCVAINEKPANVIYVGNNYESDARAARDAGLLGVWIDRYGLATEHHVPPIISTLGELHCF